MNQTPESSIRVAMLPGSVSRLAGGLYHSVRRLSESVNESSGVQVEVIGNTDAHTNDDLGAWKKSPTLVNSRRMFGRIAETIQCLENSDASIVHPQFLWSYGSVASLRWSNRNSDRKTVISPRGMLDPWAAKNSRLKKQFVALLFERRHMRRAACFHALCESEAKSIRAFGVKNPIFVIPNGVDIPSMTKVQSLRDKKPSGLKTLLYIGRIHPKKGLEHLIQAWARSKAKEKGWQLKLAGWDEGGHQDLLQQVERDCGLHGEIVWPGSLYGDEKSKALATADGYILPSFSEGLPMAVLEAWSFGLPVIKTSFCNLPIGFQANAAIETEPNAESLTLHLNEFFEMTTAQRNEMGKNGRQLAEDQFDWQQIADQMCKLYRWVRLGGHKPAFYFD